MTNLTETAYQTRKIINYSIIGLVVLIILKLSWTIFSNYWILTHPPLAPPPNIAFGKLPRYKFPDEGKDYRNTFRLETVSGSLPEGSSSGKVYFMPVLSANLLALDRSIERAKTLGFANEPVSLSPEEYIWSDPQNPLRTLTINIITGNLNLSYDYRQDQSLLTEKNLPTNFQATEEAKNFLSNNNLSKEDLAMGTPRISYLRLQGGVLVEVGGLVDADFVKLQFDRVNLDNMAVLTPSLNKSPITVIFSGSTNSLKRIVDLSYNYQLIDRENFATYPLKTINSAWEELKTNKGYIADFGTDPALDKVIRNVYLVYYDSLSVQTYLVPVYVFEGDKGFKAYVPAISPEWINSETN